MNLNLQSARIFNPLAARILALQSSDIVERIAALAELVLGICLPVQRFVRVRAAGFHHLRERIERLLPVAFVDGLLARRIGLVGAIASLLRLKAGEGGGWNVDGLRAGEGRQRDVENQYEPE